MSTSVPMLKDWFREGVKQKATHMIVVCDTFDYDDYPVYVSIEQDARAEVRKRNNESMQKVMEVYDLRKSMESQMAPGSRVFNY